MKKTAFILALALAVSLISGCSSSAAKPKDFSKAGMTITLTEDFVEKDIISQTAYYESMDSIVTALKEELSDFVQAGIRPDITLMDYAEIVVAGNGFEAEINQEQGLVYFTFDQEVNGKDFSYFATVFETDDSFWLLQFASETKNFEKFEPKFKEWAKSVKFDSVS